VSYTEGTNTDSFIIQQSVRAADVYDVVDMQLPDGSSYTGQISKINNLKHGHGS
jgi:hypothetical protein